MGYLHIENLYKNQTILTLFKECYALEKIHGTSAHISYNAENKQLKYFSGGEKHENFIKLFNNEFLLKQFTDNFIDSNVVIFGEAYGGKQQGMSKTYGSELKFIAFDVKINDTWVTVPNAEKISKMFNIEFVDYIKVETNLDLLNYERDKDSVQAIRNGVGTGKLREGVVLRPLEELNDSRSNRIIAKHKRVEFQETKTPREVKPEDFEILKKANEIADEWCTEMRLHHVLDKMPQDTNIENTKEVIIATIEDIFREANGEIIESKEAKTAIGSKTAKLFKHYLNSKLSNG